MFQNPEQAFGGTSTLLETIDTIYSAVQEPALWNVALGRIAAVLDGESIALSAITPDYRSPNIVALANVSEDVWEKFASYYAAINPLMARVARACAPGETIFGHALMSDADLEHTEFYADFYRPNRMHHTVGMSLAVGEVTAAFTCQRPREAGPFGAPADIICQTLKPHLVRAIQLHHRMGILEAASVGLETALTAHEHAMLGVDASLRIVVCNRTAERILEEGDSLRAVHQRLTCRDSHEATALQQLLNSVVDVTAEGAGRAVTVHRPDGSVLVIAAAPFRFSIPGQAAAVAALIFVSDPARAPQSRAESMRSVYGLTPAECRVADMLLAGLELREIAERLGVRVDTARYHLKQIFAKTGARRQTELVRRMLALPGLAV